MNAKTAFHAADRERSLDDGRSARLIAQTEALARCGTPFDFYLLSELFEPNIPEYKAYFSWTRSI